MKKRLSIFKSIQFKIPILFILMLLLSLQLISANFIRQLESQTIDNFESQLELHYDFLKTNVAQVLSSAQTVEQKETAIYQLLQDASSRGNVEIRIVDRQGYIIGTNDQTKQSLVGTKATDIRLEKLTLKSRSDAIQYVDQETNERQMRIIGPAGVDENQNPLSYIVVDSNIEGQYRQVRNIAVIFFNSSLIAIILTIVIAVLISRGITRPITEMVEQTEKISEGNYSGSVHIYGEDEIGLLGRAINMLSVRIRDAQEASEAERQRLDSVLHHMSDGVIATDRRGKIVIVNEAALDLLNLNESDAFGQDILSVLRLPKKTTFRSLFTKQDQQIISYDSSILKCDFSVIQRETGFISGIVCVLSDITEQQKIEAERRNFVSNVSHELRTPLTSIRSYTEALSDGAWKDEEVAPEFLDVIQTEANRMIRMITDLLNLSRMDQKRMHLEKELTNMNDLFNHVLNRFDHILKQDEYKEKNYQIEREVTPTDIWVEIDQDKMTQVLDNIMNNAIKYSPNGGKITAHLEASNDRILIFIKDEGMGIPRRALPKIFNRFYRVDKARSRQMGGTGLGLAISKEVIEMSGGKIWVESVENRGSIFYIELPYEPFSVSEEFE
ncbi:cell wall metabolism sensor histidine kinase WalK [Atopobacter phocae]|uniref:cell wall metabolism sensor histidine kinase WalK n=1 Tax=Atopobacter phocae TaxID=136492 RepID=UPI0004721CBA|nr:cell wall metabolism sensor histidine kinase WalK [Atopobacter phocae]